MKYHELPPEVVARIQVALMERKIEEAFRLMVAAGLDEAVARKYSRVTGCVGWILPKRSFTDEQREAEVQKLLARTGSWSPVPEGAVEDEEVQGRPARPEQEPILPHHPAPTPTPTPRSQDVETKGCFGLLLFLLAVPALAWLGRWLA